MKNLHNKAKKAYQQVGKKTITVLSTDQQMKIRGGVPPRSPMSKKASKPK